MADSARSPLVRMLSIAALCLGLFVVQAGPAAAQWWDWEPPTTPTDVTITDLQFNSVRVEWTASTDNYGWVRYDLKLEGPEPQNVGSMTTSRYFRVRTGGEYTVSVRARDGAGNSSPWTTPIPVEFPVDEDPPTTPTNLRATYAGGEVDEILWDASTDASGSIDYALYSDEAGFLLFTDDTSIEAWDLLEWYCVVYYGETHTLRVRAYDPAYNISEFSDPITVTF